MEAVLVVLSWGGIPDDRLVAGGTPIIEII